MKDKRKTRLTKEAGKGEFIGFGAFATTSPLLSSHDDDAEDTTNNTSVIGGASTHSASNSASTSNRNNTQTTGNSATPKNNKNHTNSTATTLKWSPIYQGNNIHLSTVVIPKMLKKDAVTKMKGLQEVIDYFLHNRTDSKKEHIALWCHYSYLFHNHLYYHSTATVRSLSIQCCYVVQHKLPKAFITICTQQQPEIVAMMYCAQTDVSYEVRQSYQKYTAMMSATTTTTRRPPNHDNDTNNDPKKNKDHIKKERDPQSIVSLFFHSPHKNNNNHKNSSSLDEIVKEGIWMYVYRILSYGRAKAMHDELFAKKRLETNIIRNNNNNSNTNENNDNDNDNDSNNNKNKKNNSGKPNKKNNKNNKKGAANNNTNNTNTTTTNNTHTTELSEAQRDELEEKYERIVVTALAGIHLYIQQYINNNPNHNHNHLLELIPLSSNRNDRCSNILPKIKNTINTHDDNGDDNHPPQYYDISFLWKTSITSLKSSLRRNAYQNISMLCSSASSSGADTHTTALSISAWAKVIPYHAKSLSRILIQSLSSEKESTNIPILLETIVTFLLLLSTTNNNSHDDNNNSNNEIVDVDTNQFVKPLTKLFSKPYCYASSGERWCPIVFPLVNMFGTVTTNKDHTNTTTNNSNNSRKNQIALLVSIWNGKLLAVSNNDRIAIANAVAETAAYLLLYKSSTTTTTTTTAAEEQQQIDTLLVQSDGKQLAKLWFHVLSFYLSQKQSSSLSLLGNNLAKQMIAFQNNYHPNKNNTGNGNSSIGTDNNNKDDKTNTSILSCIQDWFWSMSTQKDNNNSDNNIEEGISAIILDSNVKLIQLSKLIRLIMNNDKNNNKTTATSFSLLIPVVCAKFWMIVSQHTNSSSTVPMEVDIYEWLLTCFHYCNTTTATTTTNNSIDINGVATIMKMKQKRSNDENKDNEKEEDNTTTTAVIIENNLQKFIMNDLLHWIIMHTSTLSVIYRKQQKHNNSGILKKLVRYDFQLLKILLSYYSPSSDQINSCNNNIEDDASNNNKTLQKYWSSLLREIIGAKCDLELLTIGLQELLVVASKNNKNHNHNTTTTHKNESVLLLAEYLRCDVLDEFALQVVTSYYNNSQNNHREELYDDHFVDGVTTTAAAAAAENEVGKEEEGKNSSPSYDDDQDDEEEGKYELYKRVVSFLQICLGIVNSSNHNIDYHSAPSSSSSSSSMVVKCSVVNSWIETACLSAKEMLNSTTPTSTPTTLDQQQDTPFDNHSNLGIKIDSDDNPVLEVMLRFLLSSNDDEKKEGEKNNNSSLLQLTSNETTLILMESWKKQTRSFLQHYDDDLIRGGQFQASSSLLWENYAVNILLLDGNELLCSNFIQQASNDLKHRLFEYIAEASTSSSSLDSSSDSNNSNFVYLWSFQASRILQLCKNQQKQQKELLIGKEQIGDLNDNKIITESGESKKMAIPPLSLIGLSNKKLLRLLLLGRGENVGRSIYFQCFMNLLCMIPDSAERLELLVASCDPDGETIIHGTEEEKEQHKSLALVTSATDNTNLSDGKDIMIIHILCALSEATVSINTTSQAERVKRRQDYCSLFLDAVLTGYNDNDKKALLQRWCYLFLSFIKRGIDNHQNQNQNHNYNHTLVDVGGIKIELLLPQCIAVLSQLMDLIFARKNLMHLLLTRRNLAGNGGIMVKNDENHDSFQHGTDVAKNSMVWYITDNTKPNIRKQVKVIKVHYDAQAGYYFDIEINTDSEQQQERQTVLQRLRKHDYIDQATQNNNMISDEEILKREQLGKSMWMDIVKPTFSSSALLSRMDKGNNESLNNDTTIFLSEIMHIMISQCGFGLKRGIGSLQYEVYQTIKSIDEQLQQKIHVLLNDNSNNTQQDKVETMMSSSLWSLALMHGFGLNAPSSANNWNIQLLNFDPKPTCTLLLEYILKNISFVSDSSKQKENHALLAWLTILTPSLGEGQDQNGPKMEKRTLQQKAVLVMYQIATQMLKTEEDEKRLRTNSNSTIQPNGLEYSSTILSLRAISVSQEMLAHDDDFDNESDDEDEICFQDVEVDAMYEVVKAFSSVWENRNGHEPTCAIATESNDKYVDEEIVEAVPPSAAAIIIPSHKNCDENQFWNSTTYFSTILDYYLSSRPHIISNACEQHADKLIDSLYIPSKRWHAFRLIIDGVAFHRKSTMDDKDNDEDDEEDEEDDIITPNDATMSRLHQWTNNQAEDEMKELEEDIYLVCEWLPHRLMNEIESWADDDADDDDENDTDTKLIGRMLSWLCVLHFMDMATPRDPIYRPAFCSYINKCKVVGYILNQILLQTGLSYFGIAEFKKLSLSTTENNDDGFIYKIDQMIQQGEKVILEDNHGDNHYTKLATLVFFRTIECLPTLTKWWYEEDCPKVYVQPIRELVERNVAPKILENELKHMNARCKNNSTNGEMIVSGSNISREVMATYVQDDFQLKVLVKLPPCFPFRSAEVDCSKTLGVPEKRWKRWALQITQMLNNQGGTLQDALQLWKENVDKEFDGVEPCPVCYSVLHSKSHKLPEMECKKCHYRFHVDCLSQWFRTSGKNQCVMCQQPWAGIKVQ